MKGIDSIPKVALLKQRNRIAFDNWDYHQLMHSVPSMRRPVSVKPFLSFFSLFLLSSSFLLFPNCSHGAKPPLSPPFHPHSLLSDGRSVQVGCTRFSRCCYLVIDLCSPLRRELVQALSQSPALGGRARLLDRISLLSFLLLFSFFLPFPVFPREISRQDRLATTIANSRDL